MTHREEQILEWIRENPMISQHELADKAGITRSSVGVHISNLMKKGYIAGKGYVLHTMPYAVVIGGLNKDIGGKPNAELIGKDSNPGKVIISIGGVGHNIACNMTLLGINTSFLTALGSDEFTVTVTDSCKQWGIDISHAVKIPGKSSATYLFITNKDGDMEMAISDMDIFENVTPEYLEGNLPLLSRAKVIVADTNIPKKSLKWLTESCNVPVFVDTVSTTKAKKIKKIMGNIHTLKPNKLEAEVLSGIKITGDDSLLEAAERMLDTGLKRVFISLGDDGVFYADCDSHEHLPCPKARLVNTTGGGDAFMAGLVWSYINGKSAKESALIGGGAAAIAVESSATINTNMNIDDVLSRTSVSK